MPPPHTFTGEVGWRVGLTVRVDCYAGYKGEETPRRFCLGERVVEIVELLDRWLAPDHAYFKVRGDDGGSGRWELTMFERHSPLARR